MAPISDLVRDSKLETTFSPGYTRHVYYVSGESPRERKKMIEECWERGRNLGTGACGIVWLEKLVKENGEEEYRASKELSKGSKQRKLIDYSRELEAMAKFSHKKYEMFFVKSFGWYESPESVFIAMEYFPLGDLQNYLSLPLPEKDVQQITSQVLEGLSFMHDNGFAHRDLKPTNILVKSEGPDWWLKIGDFGISKRVEDGLTALRSFKGTFGFIAPEILVKQKFIDLDDNDFEINEEYTLAVDLWSVGEVAFRALTTEQPFPIRSLRTYIKGTSPFPEQILQSHGVTKEGCDFLRSLMTLIPKDRLTAREALSHTWIKLPNPSSTNTFLGIQRSDLAAEVIPSIANPNLEDTASWTTVISPLHASDILARRVSAETLSIRQNSLKKVVGMISKVADALGNNSRFQLEEKLLVHRNQEVQPEGTLLLSVFDGKKIMFWDVTTGALHHSVDGIFDEADTAVISPDGRVAAVYRPDEIDGVIRLYDTGKVTFPHRLRGHSGGVRRAIFSPNSTIIASTSSANEIRLWDVKKGALLHKLDRHSVHVSCAAFSPDGKLVASVSNLSATRIWVVATGQLLHTLIQQHRLDVVSGVTFSPDNRIVAITHLCGIVKLWDVKKGVLSSKLDFRETLHSTAVFSPDCKLVATDSGARIMLWDLASGVTRCILKAYTVGNVGVRVAFSPDGKLLACPMFPVGLRLWSVADELINDNFEQHLRMVVNFAFSPDGKLVAGVSTDGTVELCDTTTGASYLTLGDKSYKHWIQFLKWTG